MVKDNLFFKILDNEYLLNNYEFDIRETLTFAGEEKFGRLNKISKNKLDKRCDYFGGIKNYSREEYYKYNPIRYLKFPSFDFCITFSKDTPGKFFINNSTKVSNLYMRQEIVSGSRFCSYEVYRKKKNNAEFGPNHTSVLWGTNSTRNLKGLKQLDLFAVDYLDLKQLIKYKQIFWHSVMKETGFDLLAFPLYSDYLKLLGKDKSFDLNLTKKLIDRSIEYHDFLDAFSFGSYSYFDYEDESYENYKSFINLAKNLDKEVLMALYFFKVIEFLPFELAISTTNKIFNHNDGNLYSYNPLLDKDSSVRNFNKIKNKFFQIELDDSIENGNFINKNIYKIEFKKNKISELNTTLFLLENIYKGYVEEVKKFADNNKVPWDYSLQRLYRLTEI